LPAEGQSLTLLHRGLNFQGKPEVQKKFFVYLRLREYIRSTKHLLVNNRILNIAKLVLAAAVVVVIIIAIPGGGW
jgi:hypothetical protein